MRNIELRNCDFVKTILMLLVVLYHSCLFWNGGWFIYQEPILCTSEFSRMMTYWLGSWHTYAFALVSGYLFYYLRYEKEAYQEFNLFISKKIQRLLMPAYFVGLIWIIPVNTYFWGRCDKQFFKFVSGVSSSQLWFLFMLFDVFMLAYIVGG